MQLRSNNNKIIISIIAYLKLDFVLHRGYYLKL